MRVFFSFEDGGFDTAFLAFVEVGVVFIGTGDDELLEWGVVG